MTSTTKFELPLVQASQAQKHVTVNEAVQRLEAVSQLRIEATSVPTPPVAPSEGEVYAVGPGATGLWTGADGLLAVFLNGGWEFITPRTGWTAWEAESGQRMVFDGVDWIANAMAVSPSGAATAFELFEIDHSVSAGGSSETIAFIPANTVVFAVTGRVLASIGGAGTFSLGVAPSALDRYGSGLGVAQGSWLRGVTGQPVTDYSDPALTLTARGGIFTGGVVRLVVHGARFALPRGD